MTNENIDLNKFVDLFDTVMNSDNPTVQKCFKNLLLVVSIAHAEDVCNKTDGPLRGLVRRVDELERSLRNFEYLHNKMYYTDTNTNTNTNPYINPYQQIPSWTTTTNGYVPPNGGAYSIDDTVFQSSYKFK